MEQQTGFKELFLRLVAIVGLIAVLILGAWGIILLAFNLVGLFSGTIHWSDLFSNNAPAQQAATTTPSVVITQPATGGSGAASPSNATTNAGSNTSSAQPTAVYTAAPRTQQLYGLPDLAVSITSVTRSATVAGRVIVSFVISNAGTNVAQAGWSFTAQLPLTPAYTYQSAPQQAMYPGDKIAYTLTYDDPNYYNTYNQNQYCTQQYPYNCYNSNQYPYAYSNTPSTCYTYNGYQNVAGPCVTGYDQSGNPIYGSNTAYEYSQYPYGYTTGTYGYPYTQTVSVTVDPQNWVSESSKYNNTASQSF